MINSVLGERRDIHMFIIRKNHTFWDRNVFQTVYCHGLFLIESMGPTISKSRGKFDEILFHKNWGPQTALGLDYIPVVHTL